MTVLTHLETTFAEAERLHPDVMEHYSCRLVEAETADVRRDVMEAGLRETFRQRNPMPDGCEWPDHLAKIGE